MQIDNAWGTLSVTEHVDHDGDIEIEIIERHGQTATTYIRPEDATALSELLLRLVAEA